MYKNGLPENAEILGYRNYDYVLLFHILFMLEDSLTLISYDDELSHLYSALKSRVVELCDFPVNSRNNELVVACLDVD